jgi:uncharacterized membrane protein
MEEHQMVKSRLQNIFLSLLVVIVVLVGFAAIPMAVSAEDTTATATATATPEPPPELKLNCDIPTYSDNSGSSFNFSVGISYSGNTTVTVNLSAAAPQGWYSLIMYSSKEVSSLPMGPMMYSSPDSKSISVTMYPNSGNSPDVGQYKLTLTASTGDLSKSIDLTAVVKAKYQFSMSTDSGKLSTTATAGKENSYSFNLKNEGSVTLENINLNVSKPENWEVTFVPDKVSSIGAGQTQKVDVKFKPPSGKTVAGDYIITLRSSNEHVASSMDVRVTVETSSMWGVISIIIIVVVIAGLAFLFLRLGRR